MRKHLSLAAALSLAVGGVALFAQQQPGQPGQPQTPALSGQNGQMEHRASAQMPEGLSKVQVTEARELQSTVAKLTESVLKGDDPGTLLTYLTKDDSKRISEQFKQQNDQLKQAITQSQQTWKQKYNKDFQISDQVALFGGNFTIMRGDIADPKLLGNFPVKNDQMNREPGGSQQIDRDRDRLQGGAAQPGQGAGATERQSATGADDLRRNQNQGAAGQNAAGQQGAGQQDQGNVAVVVYPASHGLPETYVSFVKEEGQWKIDIPDDITGQQLSQNLRQHLTHMNQGLQQWPEDQTQAYRLASHHVVAALYGVQSRQGGAQGGPGANPGQGQDRPLGGQDR